MGHWNQNRDANWQVPYTGGWCLKYVQDAFGTDHPYPSAMDAWNANYGGGNHPGELPPEGKTAALYFSLGSVPAGHVAIGLDDGKVASSTQAGNHPVGYIHPNMQDLMNLYGQYNGGCTYLGWSEYVGTVQVLQWITDIVYATADQIQQAYREILERDADSDGIAHYENYTIDFVRQDLYNSQEYANLQAIKNAPKPVDPPVEVPEEPTTPEVPTEPETPIETPTDPVEPEKPIEPAKPVKSENNIFAIIKRVVKYLWDAFIAEWQNK